MSRLELGGDGRIHFLIDRSLRRESGIVVAFTLRTGGASRGPYSQLNLAGHVGDHPGVVDANRDALLRALDLGHLRDRLTTAEQVHGLGIAEMAAADAGKGAHARPGTRASVPATDALVTRTPDLPLMMMYADCVPVVLVAREPLRAVAVVHAGWKGALGRLPAKAAERVADTALCETSDLLAYIGPHIGPCHYQVDDERLSLFTKAFGSIAAARGGLDLGAVVSQSLNEVGVPLRNVVQTGICTAERTDAYYSFRAEGVTGRHGALSVILGSSR